VVWDVTPCSPVSPICWMETLSPSSGSKNKTNEQQRTDRKYDPSKRYLFGLLFEPEDGRNIFLRNVGELMSDCVALHSRLYSS
jgi:hypothetical protein